MSDGRFALEVFVFGTSGFSGSLVFTARQVTVGRDPRAMVRLDDPTVSLRHAVLDLSGDSVSIRDLGSRAGTTVNGRPIAGDVVVRASDEVKVGAFRLRVTVHRQEAEAPPPRPAAIAVPTPYEEITVLADRRLMNPPTQLMERRPQQVDEEVTVTGLVVKREGEPAEAPAAGRAVAARGAAHPRDFWPEPMRAPEPSASDIRDAPSEPWLRKAAPQTQPQPQPQARVAPATVPLAFQPAKLAPPPVAPQLQPQPQPAVERPRAAIRPWESSPQPARLPVPASHGESEDDDDEDDDTNFVPPFDLLAEISRAGASSAAAVGPMTVEAVHFRGDRVLSIRHVGPGRSLRMAGMKIGARDGGGAFKLAARAPRSFTVRQDGKRRASDEGDAASHGLTLCAGMQVEIELAGEDGVLVQLVPRAPALAPVERSLRPMLEDLKPGAASVAVHLALLVIFGLSMLGGKNAIADDLNAGRFATIKVQEPELAPPPPTPEPTPPDKSTPMIPTHTAKKDPTAPAKSNAKVPDQPQTAAPPEPGAAAQSILKALGGAASGPATPDISALANLDAMPRGRSGFRVSDSVGKGPGDSLRMSTGNADATINTKTGAELGNVGKLDVKPGSGAVRARVSGIPAAVAGEGHLDRGAIQKVVNSHLFQVQGCYERQLAANPNLAGKATFQWVITPSGGVAGVRIAGSSLASVEAMSCIQAAISRWSFPKPEGGSVTVTYPFAFTTFGN